jgi:hypothetical protein
MGECNHHQASREQALRFDAIRTWATYAIAGKVSPEFASRAIRQLLTAVERIGTDTAGTAA